MMYLYIFLFFLRVQLLSAGIKAEDLPEKPKKKKVADKPVEKIEEEEEAKGDQEVAEEVAEEVKEEAEKVVEEVVKTKESEQPPSLVDEPLQPIVETPAKKVEAEEEDDTNYFVVGVLFAIFAHLFFKAHVSISTPLSPGSTLSLGKSKNSCGLLGSFPFYECEPKSLTMGPNGILEVFEGEELVFSLEGKVCEVDEEGCVDGVVIDEDGTLKIGGEKARAKMKPIGTLTPWPFSEDVVYKTGIRNLI